MALDDDLNRAVAAGIITNEQAARLGAFLEAMRPAPAVAAPAVAAAPMAFAEAPAGAAPAPAPVFSDGPDEESVRFVRGFQDIFLTIGVVLLLVGVGIAGPMLLPPVGGAILGAAVAFGLALLLARKHRLVLPSMALATGFTFFAGFAAAGILGTDLWEAFGDEASEGGRAMLIVGFVWLLAAGTFYLVFRLPFALALVALSIIPIVFGVLAVFVRADVELIMLPTFLILGIAAFVAAMAFDFTDPERKTLRADNAFWLHLVAAPLIVQSTIALVTVGGRFSMTVEDALIIIGVVLLLGFVAIVVDRRALLVAGLGYLSFAVARLMYEADMAASGVLAATLIVIGAAVVALGVGWRPIRRALIGGFPRRGLLAHLPPV